ncbi:hypothetical protein [Thermocatellispora tengchongensis]|uniref:hypothetical protein n=1 Tax=Thermocatellispora tengchongensis TaxID=1073253 RepID=UPI0036334792
MAIEDDGTLTLRSRDGLEARGVGRIVDGGDAGDTYNHAPPARDRLVSAPAWVKVEEVCRGPLVWAAEIVREYSWPRSSTPEERSAETVPVVVTTRAELRAGEPFLRLEVGFDNRALDHRVRWHAPLPAPAAESYAAGQFAVVRRGTTAEGGGGERPLPTFPAESFVTAGGLALLLDQATEYELIPDGPELAITLVRSVGHLSRNRNPYRDEPAGPEVATPGAQCPGPITTRFAVHLHTPPGTRRPCPTWPRTTATTCWPSPAPPPPPPPPPRSPARSHSRARAWSSPPCANATASWRPAWSPNTRPPPRPSSPAPSPPPTAPTS